MALWPMGECRPVVDARLLRVVEPLYVYPVLGIRKELSVQHGSSTDRVNWTRDIQDKLLTEQVSLFQLGIVCYPLNWATEEPKRFGAWRVCPNLTDWLDKIGFFVSAIHLYLNLQLFLVAYKAVFLEGGETGEERER